MLERERYLHFDNIDMGLPDITSWCSRCGETFNAKSKTGEKVDDVLVRIRGQFNAHRCHNPLASRASTIHYHICWSDSTLDWKRFPTKEEAIELAGHIKRPNESYMIVERDGECERCKVIRSDSNP